MIAICVIILIVTAKLDDLILLHHWCFLTYNALLLLQHDGGYGFAEFDDREDAKDAVKVGI